MREKGQTVRFVPGCGLWHQRLGSVCLAKGDIQTPLCSLDFQSLTTRRNRK
jgi:hypothetical protein